MNRIPFRSGARPKTSDAGPHSQTSDQSSPELWGRLVAEAIKLQYVVEGKSAVSPISSRALLFEDLTEITNPETSLTQTGRLEPVHIHGVLDTSLHLCLPKQRAREICELGWGEPHKFADCDTEIMIYGPRDSSELHLIIGLIQESIDFARS